MEAEGKELRREFLVNKSSPEIGSQGKRNLSDLFSVAVIC
jgi:hypothetical protein